MECGKALKVIRILENGGIQKHLDMVFTNGKMVINMKVSGLIV